MSIIDMIRRRFGAGRRDGSFDAPAGHAPGHRHTGPPPEVQTPEDATPKGASDQPWVRTTHSDSQERRPRG